MQKGSRSYQGACHCGALTYRYDTAAVPAAWSVRACQCSFCRRHAGLTTSDPAGSLAFYTSESGALQRYRFGSRLTEFLICRTCGVYVGATTNSDEGRFGVINLRALNAMPEGLPAPEPMHYDDESPESRGARRAARWTPLIADSL